MYIPPFTCGVIVTLAAEFVLIIAVVVLVTIIGKEGGKSNAEESDAVPTSTYDRDGKEKL